MRTITIRGEVEEEESEGVGDDAALEAETR